MSPSQENIVPVPRAKKPITTTTTHPNVSNLSNVQPNKNAPLPPPRRANSQQRYALKIIENKFIRG